MKKFLLPFFIFFYPLLPAVSQNLVNNPSFEEMVQCPDGFTTIAYSNGWSSYNGTPDYLNRCATNISYSIPDNGWGNQNPSSTACNAYAGFWGYSYPGSPNYREFIASQLLTPLLIGQKYFFSCKVSLGEISNCGINNIGVLFLTNEYSQLSVNNAPKIFSIPVILDTLNWTNITGSFVTDSAYNYIVLGNFFSDSLTAVSIYAPPDPIYGYEAYYYLDDICLSTDSTICNPFNFVCNVGIQENDLRNFISVYPNPFSDKATIKINSNENSERFLIKISDVFGRTIQSIKTTERKVEISRDNLSNGIYFVDLFINQNEYKTKIIIIN